MTCDFVLLATEGEEYLLFTSKLANQHDPKALVTCVLYTNIIIINMITSIISIIIIIIVIIIITIIYQLNDRLKKEMFMTYL